jgi:hypothetical protein
MKLLEWHDYEHLVLKQSENLGTLLDIHILHEVGGMSDMLRRATSGLYHLIDVGSFQAMPVVFGRVMIYPVVSWLAYAKCPPHHHVRARGV